MTQVASCAQVPCLPQCFGKNCGPDGCGGTCGECPAGESCSSKYSVCYPNDATTLGEDGRCSGAVLERYTPEAGVVFEPCLPFVCANDPCDGKPRCIPASQQPPGCGDTPPYGACFQGLLYECTLAHRTKVTECTYGCSRLSFYEFGCR